MAKKPKGKDEIQEMSARIRAHLRISDLRFELAERNRLLEAADLEARYLAGESRRCYPAFYVVAAGW